MQAQSWICPKCYDDHSMKGECSPIGVDKFSPAPDDKSYIAEEFRKLETRLASAEALLERAKTALLYYDSHDLYGTPAKWLEDFDKWSKV